MTQPPRFPHLKPPGRESGRVVLQHRATLFNPLHVCRRPYRVECTGSLPTSEVKRHRARLVLGWGAAWEDLSVLSAFFFFYDLCQNCARFSSRSRSLLARSRAPSGRRATPCVLVPSRGTAPSKNCVHFSICACHPCAGAMLIFSVSFQL